jgi:hypothetical protein
VQVVRKVKIAVLIAVLALISSSFLEVKAQGQFVGSVNSDVYHYPSCTYASRIKPENRIWFADVADALNHGYRPCKVCNPPVPEMTFLYFVFAFVVITGATIVIKRKSLFHLYQK